MFDGNSRATVCPRQGLFTFSPHHGVCVFLGARNACVHTRQLILHLHMHNTYMNRRVDSPQPQPVQGLIGGGCRRCRKPQQQQQSY